MTLWEIDIRPREGLPDLAAASVVGEAAELALADDLHVTSARGYLVEGQLTESQVNELARQLFSDEVVERTVVAPVGDDRLSEPPNGRQMSLVHVLPKPGVMDPEEFASRDYFGATALADDMMTGFLTEHVAYLSDEGKQEMEKVIAALSAEASLPAQAEMDSKDAESGLLDEGRELMGTALSATEDAEAEYSCTDCHKFGDEGDLGQVSLPA